jgi:hypothetical protein
VLIATVCLAKNSCLIRRGRGGPTDKDVMEWLEIEFKGSSPSMRNSHRAVVKDNFLLVHGGRGTSILKDTLFMTLKKVNGSSPSPRMDLIHQEHLLERITLLSIIIPRKLSLSLEVQMNLNLPIPYTHWTLKLGHGKTSTQPERPRLLETDVR